MNFAELLEKEKEAYRELVNWCVRRIDEKMLDNIVDLGRGAIVEITGITAYNIIKQEYVEIDEDLASSVLKHYQDDWDVDYHILPEKAFVFKRKTNIEKGFDIGTIDFRCGVDAFEITKPTRLVIDGIDVKQFMSDIKDMLKETNERIDKLEIGE